MDKSKLTLYLIRGVPGSGKSTLAETFETALLTSGVRAVRIEADMYFYDDDTGEYNFNPSQLAAAHYWCQYGTIGALQSKNNVIVSNTSTTEKEVEVYRKIAEECNANFVSIIIENRHGGKNVHNVPEEKIQQMKQRFSVKL